MVDLEWLNKEIEKYSEAYEWANMELGALPDGSLVCMSDKKGRKYYYHAYKDEDGAYVRKGVGKNRELKQMLARKGFLEELVKGLSINISVLKKARSEMIDCDSDSVISRLRNGLRELPLDYYLLPAAEEIVLGLDSDITKRVRSHQEWGNATYEKSTRYVENLSLITSQGEKMRSKAELLVAERLYAFGIPFRYEQVLHLGDIELAPDFTFEDAKHEEFYLELCGMMDDEYYVKGFMRKRELYEMYGITEWSNMIYYFTTGNDIDMVDVDAMIKARILPRF